MSTDNSTPSDDRRGAGDGRPQRDHGGRQGGEYRGGPRRDDDRGGSRPDGERRQWDNRGDSRGGSRPDGERRQWDNRGDSRGGSRPEGERRQWDNRGGPRRDDGRGGSRPEGERRQWDNRGDSRGGSRPEGERRQWDNRGGSRPDGDRPQRSQRDGEERSYRPGTAPKIDEPATPSGFVESELPVGVRAELKGLPKDLADIVGAHIWAAGQLVDEDPELAFRHAEAARRRAGRLPIVREAAAETAYAAGEYAIALREFRAIRRMSGGDQLIPVIADCERALGRPRDALEVLAELDPNTKDIWLRMECLLVEAGIRADLGQRAEAMRLLQAAISRKVGPPFGQARLRYAYANLLEEEGDVEGAREWFSSAAALDQGAELDTSDRIAQLDGVILPDFTPDEEEDDEPEGDESRDTEVEPEVLELEDGEPESDDGHESQDAEAEPQDPELEDVEPELDFETEPQLELEVEPEPQLDLDLEIEPEPERDVEAEGFDDEQLSEDEPSDAKEDEDEERAAEDGGVAEEEQD